MMGRKGAAAHRGRAGSRGRFAAEAAPTRINRRSAPEPARDAVAVVARPGADQRDLVHLRYAEQAQRVPVRDAGFDVVAAFKELQLTAPVRLPAATQVDDVGDRAVLVLRTVVVRVERSEEHPSELQSLMRITSAVFCL